MFITIRYPDIDRTGRRLSKDGGGCVKFDLNSFAFKLNTRKLANGMSYNDVCFVLLMLVAAACAGYNAYYTIWNSIKHEYYNYKVPGKTAVNEFIDHCINNIPGVITPEYLEKLTKKSKRSVIKCYMR